MQRISQGSADRVPLLPVARLPLVSGRNRRLTTAALHTQTVFPPRPMLRILARQRRTAVRMASRTRSVTAPQPLTVRGVQRLPMSTVTPCRTERIQSLRPAVTASSMSMRTARSSACSIAWPVTRNRQPVSNTSSCWIVTRVTS